MVHTLPSAQLCISFSGRGARYIAVVSHHNGRPTVTTTTQKERITIVRVRVFSGVSRGGDLGSAETGTVVSGGFSCPVAMTEVVPVIISLASGPNTVDIV